MAKWNKTCNSFAKVRAMLEDDIETTSHCMKIMYAIEACCDELTPDNEKDWLFYDDFRDLKANLHDEVEHMDEYDYDSCEEIVNNWLNELYDLCDASRVWLSM